MDIIIHSEPLEDPQLYRLFTEPDTNNPIYKAYKTAQEAFWTDEEVDGTLKIDAVQWPTIEPKIQHLVVHQVTFFLIGDGRVNQTISEHIDSRITDREVLVWYNYQKMMEDIHNVVYVKLVDTYITDPKERNKAFNAVNSYPIIGKKINWLKKWLGEGNDLHRLEDETVQTLKDLKQLYHQFSELSSKFTGNSAEVPQKFRNLFGKLDDPKPLLARQILINIIMEGLFFQGSFCIIFWINHQYGKLPGLTKANESISRDEGMHTDFGIGLYNKKIVNRLPQTLIHQIFNEAVELEIEFMAEALPNGLLNMNIVLMSKYIKFVADKLLSDLKYEKIYQTKNPFDFMEKQSISVRIGDFFMDPNITEYRHHSAGTTTEDKELCFGDEF